MSEIIDHLASLTGLRDRDTLDVSLAHAMRDFLAPRCVAVCRLVGEPGDERWLTRAALLYDAPAATADPAWVDLESLPRADQRPARLQCLNTAEIVEQRTDGLFTTLFPVMSDTGAVGVIELQ
ncbi:MAG TPA: GGDEF domain-containing protein, partial [Burkholderiaceae bacterium]|nr:GGDEF domain-containing protein [Burkholderiaceae bacterium]